MVQFWKGRVPTIPKPNHWKSKQNGRQFCSRFPMVLDKMATVLLKTKYHWETKQWATLGIPKVFGIPAPTELQLFFSVARLINFHFTVCVSLGLNTLLSKLNVQLLLRFFRWNWFEFKMFQALLLRRRFGDLSSRDLWRKYFRIFFILSHLGHKTACTFIFRCWSQKIVVGTFVQVVTKPLLRWQGRCLVLIFWNHFQIPVINDRDRLFVVDTLLTFWRLEFSPLDLLDKRRKSVSVFRQNFFAFRVDYFGVCLAIVA